MNVTAPALEAPKPHSLTWGFLLLESYRLYRQRFWKLFRIALLPYLLAYVASFFYGFAFQQLRQLGMVSFPPRSRASFAAPYATTYILGWIQGALYWGISGFFFGAVASNILSGPNEAGLAVSDAFTRSRERIGAVTGVALIGWTLFWLGRSAALLALLPLIGGPAAHRSGYGIILLESLDIVVSLMLAGLLSRFGLAIPVLIEEPGTSFRAALKFSVGKTENWEPFFMIFLAKSAILGYAVFWLGSYTLQWLWQHDWLNTTTFPWADKAAYIAIIAALGPPLFIAFSLLYRESTRPRKMPSLLRLQQ